MALFCASSINRQLLSTIRQIPSIMGVAGVSSRSVPKISYKPHSPQQVQTHDEKNMKLGRPMSPHLTVYNLQLTSVTSITHRITGMIITGYVVVLGCGALVLPNDVSHYIGMIQGLDLSSATLFATKLILSVPFGYHLANGIRHLLWDSGRQLTLKEVYTTGYMMLASTLAISVALACL